MLLVNHFIKGKPVLSKDPVSLPRNLPNCKILDSWFFDNFMLADELADVSFTIF